MEKVNSIFQLISALFFGVALIFFLTYERMWDSPLEAGTVVSWLLVGTVLHLISWAVTSMAKRNMVKKIDQAEMEKKELKAMVFDLERTLKLGKIDRKLEGGDVADRESSSIKPRENFK
ncbi:MAG: hypothetical protein JJU34_20590 [Lunatimonas sp.]|uniref:hypothetical protein n=1 Tax=Lunatimonas sp. TaxID=2060141 RepID=UPI00263B9B79|nr:hypothetical protein [Lunatimonas sp.]MCC5939691.1 hypothetical protein [Lunatimonas sp.]